MDMSIATALVGMQSASNAQQMSLVALQQAHAMAQVAVDLLSNAAEAGKALLPAGVGGTVDRSA